MTEFTPEWIELYKMVFTENKEKMFSNTTSLGALDEIQRLQSRVQVRDAEIERLKSTLQDTIDKIKEKINKEIKFERDNIYYSDVDYKQGVIRGLQQSIKIIEEFEGTK